MKEKQREPKIRFHHVGIVVKDISEAIDKYTAAFDIEKESIEVESMSYLTGKGESEEFKYAFLPLAEGENNFIELVQPLTAGPTARYLEKHGEGLFHLAFESPRIKETISQFNEAGIPQAGATPTEDVLSVFLHPKFANGVLIQIIKKGVFNGLGRISSEVLQKEKGTKS
jgi:catechol 2,3-dioxygenase-like lactoylglutathione lyase family enzyme